ncbi:MAG: ABC transporter substrate-binding protein [Deltaproteobacteria bacterium]|nr:ABC transporter substrate-binding protein [Deltaproteobacteria bacterium]
MMHALGKFPWFHVWLLAAVAVSGCGQSPKSLPVLRLGHAPHDHHSPLYVAAMNADYFRAHGGIYLKETVYRQDYELIDQDRVVARVLIDSSPGGEELIRRLAEGLFDMSFGGVPAMLSFMDKGSPIRIVAPVMAEGTGLVVRRDLPADSWQDFLSYIRTDATRVKIGYKVAVSVQNLVFKEALRESGITFSDDPRDSGAQVLLVNLFGEKNLIPALENGLVDGFVTMQPFIAMAEERGIGKVASWLADLPPPGKWRGSPCCALAANDAYAAANPEISAALVTLMLRSMTLIRMNPEKSAEQIAQWLDTSPAIEGKSIPTISFLQDYDQNWTRGMELWVEAMVKSNILQGKVKEAYAGGKLPQVIYNREIFDKAKQNL